MPALRMSALFVNTTLPPSARLKTSAGAGIAQARNFYDGGSAQVQSRPRRQSQQIHPTRGDIFTHLPGKHGKTGDTQLIGVQPGEVTDAVRLGRVAGHPGTVVDPLPRVGVTLDTQSGEEANALLIQLGKRVSLAAAHGDDGSIHERSLPSLRCGIEVVLDT
jgi:hypothetical protein